MRVNRFRVKRLHNLFVKSWKHNLGLVIFFGDLFCFSRIPFQFPGTIKIVIYLILATSEQVYAFLNVHRRNIITCVHDNYQSSYYSSIRSIAVLVLSFNLTDPRSTQLALHQSDSL